MRVTIEALGHMRSFLGEGEASRTIELPEGATVANALTAIGVPEGEQWNAGIDGRLVYAGTVLGEGDRLLVFTPIAGGRDRLRRTASRDGG